MTAYRIKFLATLALLVLFLCGYSYKCGINNTKSKWDAEKAEVQDYVLKLENEYLFLIAEHERSVEELEEEARRNKEEFEAALVRANDAYTDRLRSTEQRASVYQRQAQADATERRNLANHAAELDRTLEEGRHLVRQLRTTLRQRELEIGRLGQQILLDRSTLEKADSVNGQ